MERKKQTFRKKTAQSVDREKKRKKKMPWRLDGSYLLELGEEG